MRRAGAWHALCAKGARDPKPPFQVSNFVSLRVSRVALDGKMEARLESAGYRVVRVASDVVFKRPHDVATVVSVALVHRAGESYQIANYGLELCGAQDPIVTQPGSAKHEQFVFFGCNRHKTSLLDVHDDKFGFRKAEA